MPRTREQFLQMQDDRVGSILKAAFPLYALKGEKLTIDAISEKAKCSHGIVYHYFNSTEAIIKKIENSPAFLQTKAEIFGDLEGNSYEKIESIIKILLDVDQSRIEKVSCCYLLLKAKGKGSLNVLLRGLVKDAQTSRLVIGGEPEDILNCVFTLLRGIYLPFLIEKHPEIQVPSLESVMQLIRKPLTF